MINREHSKRATKALQIIAERDITFSSLALWCYHTDKDDLEFAAANDGKTVFYGRNFESFSIEEQQGIAAHQLSHIAWRHQSRGKQLRSRYGAKYSQKIFNIATDAIINETLIAAGYALPLPRVVLTELFKDIFQEEIKVEEALSEWDAERLYVRLISLQSSFDSKSLTDVGTKPQRLNGSDQVGEKKSETSNRKQNGRGQTSLLVDKLEGPDAITSPCLIEEWAEQHGFQADFDTEGKHTVEDADEDSEWQLRLVRAIDLGRIAGRGIGALKVKLADLPQTRTPWEVILRVAVTKAVTKAPRPSLSLPTRRWLAMEADAIARETEAPGYERGFIKQTHSPRIVIGFDTSGSIWEKPELLRLFGSEISGIGRRTGAEIHVIVFDNCVHSITRLDGIDWKAEAEKMNIEGGGGTSFVEVIEEAKKLSPSIIVMLTDLVGTFPSTPAKIPVIWASPDPNPLKAPFGRVISMAR